MAHNFRWDDLQILLAVASERSLSGAARAIGVNHATVLRRIEALEGKAGVTLFDRPPGGYRLRPEAQNLMSSLTSIAQSVDRVERSLIAARLGTGGSVRLTTTDSIAHLLLPRHLARLRALHPEMEVSVIVSNLPLDLTRPEAEITIRPAVTLPSGLKGQQAAKMGFGIYASAAYLADNPGDEPAQHRWIGVEPPLSRSPVGEFQNRLPTPPLVRADSFPIMARLAAEGEGLTMIPDFVARAEPDLVAAPAFPERVTTSIWIAAHADLAAVPQVAQLMDFFVQALRSDQDVLA